MCAKQRWLSKVAFWPFDMLSKESPQERWMMMMLPQCLRGSQVTEGISGQKSEHFTLAELLPLHVWKSKLRSRKKRTLVERIARRALKCVAQKCRKAFLKLHISNRHTNRKFPSEESFISNKRHYRYQTESIFRDKMIPKRLVDRQI